MVFDTPLPCAQCKPSQLLTTTARVDCRAATHTYLSLLSWIHGFMEIQKGIYLQPCP